MSKNWIVKALSMLLVAALLRAGLPPRPAAVHALSDTVVISQVYGGGGNTGAAYKNDYIELFNRGNQPVELSGWSVQYASAAGSTWQVTGLAGTLQPGQYLLIHQASGAGGTLDLPSPDATGSIAMSATSGKVALVASLTPLSGNCPSSSSFVDLLGYGAANCAEGSPAATLSNTTAAKRENNGCTESDNNAADFSPADPTTPPQPRNRAVAATLCNPGQPHLYIEHVSMPEGDSGEQSAQLSARLTEPAGSEVRFDVTFSDGSAIAGEDYHATDRSDVTLPAGETVFSFDVTVIGDAVPEGDETLTIELSNVSGAMTSQGSATLTILTEEAAIYTIQSDLAASPYAGRSLTTRGVVVGDYQDSGSLRGFYIQDESGDGNPATSDGIFVFNNLNTRVSLGQRAQVSGSISEYFGETQISASQIEELASGPSLEPALVRLPFASPTEPEQYEGMLVRFDQTLWVTDTYNLGRFGEVALSASDRLYQPTQLEQPGAQALAAQQANQRNRILLDDASQAQNPNPIAFARGGQALTAANTLRSGDTLDHLTGVMTYTWGGASASPGAFRIRAHNALGVAAPLFQPSNPRPVHPAQVGGRLRVASFNVLNYFNTFSDCTGGAGGAALECRGANDAAEFERQADKLVSAILALDADVIGLQEIENDGYSADSALADLVNRLNAAARAQVYAFIDADAATGRLNALGTDAIKVALIYKPATLIPLATAALDTPAFVTGGDSAARNRPSLLQAFQEAVSGERFLVSVNHLKSKGSPCDLPDAGDGQGNCNAVRTLAIIEWINWIASDPTGSNDPDVLLLGDLNAYAREDPLESLRAAGYTNLIPHFHGLLAYSYIFEGQSGCLDHALASSSLLPAVRGAAVWHINADEPRALDYNLEFKTGDQPVSLYSPDPFRSADHDPLLIGLDLGVLTTQAVFLPLVRR
ncbi:MAG: ExeM/NucH family extracellular endonuclease [Chloroflexota bacterium]